MLNLVVIDKTSDYNAFCKYLNEKKRFIGNLWVSYINNHWWSYSSLRIFDLFIEGHSKTRRIN